MLAAEKNRLAAVPATFRAELRLHVRWLARRIARLDAQIAAAVSATAHKLLTILNTMARAGTRWAPPAAAPA